jgi:hypothetical protein
MRGNAIGGKPLFSTTMALVALLFLPYVSLMQKLLSSSALLDDRIPCCGCDRCCVQQSSCITRLATGIGFASCLFLAVLALVAVDDSFFVHGGSAFVFFSCISTYSVLITSVLKAMYQRLQTAAPAVNGLQAKMVADGRWCLRFKIATSAAVLFFFMVLPVAGGMAISIMYGAPENFGADDEYAAMAGSNLRAFCQWLMVLSINLWVASMSFELRNLEALGLLIPRLPVGQVQGSAELHSLGPPVVVQAVAVVPTAPATHVA